jgi:GTPase SAR1 family protein
MGYSPPPYVGVDTCSRVVNVDTREVRLNIFDTAGQERFAGLTRQYFRGGDVCLLAVDLSEGHLAADPFGAGEGGGEKRRPAPLETSFAPQERWRHEVVDSCGAEGVLFVLVGTKSDIVEERHGAESAVYERVIARCVEYAEQVKMPDF